MLEKRSNLGWGWYDSKSKPKDATKPISPNSDTLQYTTINQPRYTKMPKMSRSPSIEENSISYVTVQHKKTQAQGGFQLLDLIITELKSHMTCYNSMPLIGWNYSIKTGEQIL